MQCSASRDPADALFAAVQFFCDFAPTFLPAARLNQTSFHVEPWMYGERRQFCTGEGWEGGTEDTSRLGPQRDTVAQLGEGNRFGQRSKEAGADGQREGKTHSYLSYIYVNI